MRSLKTSFPTLGLLAIALAACSGGGGGNTPSVTVQNQTANPATRVVVAEAVTVGGGFIAIHEDTGAGVPGASIGVSAYLEDGSNSNIQVTLNRDAVDGETLYAMLHADGNDNQVYDFPNDTADGPVVDSAGAVIAPPFTVTVAPPAGPTVVAEPQVADPPNEVVVARVSYDQPGFIVIHEDDGAGSFGAGIGISSLLSPGTNNNVRVGLARNVRNGETLYAMLHDDTNGDGAYDGGDAPVQVDGAILATPFVVSLGGNGPILVDVDSQVSDPDFRVVIKEVTADVGGFIAVHADNGRGGFGGTVLGVSDYLPAGTSRDVEVIMDGSIEDGQLLFAMHHIDGDGDQNYNFPGPDGPSLDNRGNIIAPPFVAFLPNPGPFVLALAQTVRTPDVVDVLVGVLPAPGFVVVHQSNPDGTIGGVVGFTPLLEAGINSDVQITLSRPAVDGEILFAELHADGGDAVYTIGDPTDPPLFTPEGIRFAVPFEVTVQFEPEVAVQDQTAFPPDVVVISSVSFDQAGYIVIHEAGAGGSIGGVIGASEVLQPGINTDVQVILDRDAVDGETLFAMLHTDDGDGQYEFPDEPADGPVVDLRGQVVAPPFRVTRASGVKVSDQTAPAPNQVRIDNTDYAQGGFIAIHQANGSGGFDSTVIGVSSYLPAGHNREVLVTLDRSISSGETLFAMLHRDGNNDMSYTFPGADGPVLDGAGLIIAPPFTVSLP